MYQTINRRRLRCCCRRGSGAGSLFVKERVTVIGCFWNQRVLCKPSATAQSRYVFKITQCVFIGQHKMCFIFHKTTFLCSLLAIERVPEGGGLSYFNLTVLIVRGVEGLGSLLFRGVQIGKDQQSVAHQSKGWRGGCGR